LKEARLRKAVFRSERDAMFPGALIPLAVFGIVVLIVAIVHMTKLRDREIEIQHRLHLEELEHRRRMQELEMRAQSLKRPQ
jgi:hypothetical protein